MYRCEDCQRDFKTAQALSGHNQWRHANPAAGPAAQQVNQQLTKAQLQQLVAAQASNAQQQEDLVVNGFQQLDEKFSKLSGVVDELLSMPGEHGEHAEHGHSQHAHDPATCGGCRDMVEEIVGGNPDDAQAVEHVHGEDCPDCVHEQLKGVRRTTAFVEETIPGAKESLEHAITGQKMVTIVDDRSTVNTETLDNETFGRVLLGMAVEAGQRKDPDLNARLGEMMVEARRRGIWRD